MDVLRALWTWLVVLFARRCRPVVARHPHTPEVRAAVHEAGHALVARYCTAVHEVTRVAIMSEHPENGGIVQYTCSSRECEPVIQLAGVAAECLMFGRFRATEASSDLLRARVAALSEVPWPAVIGATPPFHEVFSQSPTPEIADALARAYAQARSILVAHTHQHARLVGLLLHRRELREADVAAVLGPRAGVKMVGLFRVGFACRGGGW